MTAVACLLGLQCTPQQKMWYVPIAAGEQAFISPPDRGLRIVLSGTFDPETLQSNAFELGQEGSHRIDAKLWPRPLGDDQYELFLPPNMVMRGLSLTGGCAGCLARCPQPTNVRAKIVSNGPWAGWHREASQSRTTRFATPGSSVGYLLEVRASSWPRVSVAYAGPSPSSPPRDRSFTVRRGDGRYVIVLEVDNAQTPGLLSRSWTVTIRTDGACPTAEGPCRAPSDATLELGELVECSIPSCKREL